MTETELNNRIHTIEVLVQKYTDIDAFVKKPYTTDIYKSIDIENQMLDNKGNKGLTKQQIND